MNRLLMLAALALSAFSADDKIVAEWVIRQGGHVMVNGGEPLTSLDEIPAGPFRITGIDFVAMSFVRRLTPAACLSGAIGVVTHHTLLLHIVVELGQPGQRAVIALARWWSWTAASAPVVVPDGTVLL